MSLVKLILFRMNKQTIEVEKREVQILKNLVSNSLKTDFTPSLTILTIHESLKNFRDIAGFKFSFFR